MNVAELQNGQGVGEGKLQSTIPLCLCFISLDLGFSFHAIESLDEIYGFVVIKVIPDNLATPFSPYLDGIVHPFNSVFNGSIALEFGFLSRHCLYCIDKHNVPLLNNIQFAWINTRGRVVDNYSGLILVGWLGLGSADSSPTSVKISISLLPKST
jgi:hypothetical protein